MADDRPRVSVIIPVLNAEQTLGEQLDALARQLGDISCEVLVCDNGSSDGTRNVASSYRDRIDKLRILDASDRRGASHARNIGIVHARGDVVAFCDADDVVADDWAATMATHVRSGHMVTGWLEFGLLNTGTRGGVEKHLVVVSNYLAGIASGNVALTTADARRIGGFDESFRYAVEDIDFGWRAQQAGLSVSRESALVHCRTRSDLTSLFRQHRTWGRGNIMLRVRHARVLGNVLSFKYSVKALARTGLTLPFLWWRRPRAERRALVRQLGTCLGEFEGHVIFRVLKRMPQPVLISAREPS